MPTSPPPPRRFRTVGLPQYRSKASLSAGRSLPARRPGEAGSPHTPTGARFARAFAHPPVTRSTRPRVPSQARGAQPTPAFWAKSRRPSSQAGDTSPDRGALREGSLGPTLGRNGLSRRDAGQAVDTRLRGWQGWARTVLAGSPSSKKGRHDRFTPEKVVLQIAPAPSSWRIEFSLWLQPIRVMPQMPQHPSAHRYVPLFTPRHSVRGPQRKATKAAASRSPRSLRPDASQWHHRSNVPLPARR